MNQPVRKKSRSLEVMASLNNRMSLTREKQNYYSALHKGWEGECRFDEMLEREGLGDRLIKDLCLKVNRKVFQLDTVVITPNKVYVYEVKNYEGEYIYAGDILVNRFTKNEIINPSIQLRRSAVHFRQILKQLNCHLPIEAYVVYINPHFTLYQAPAEESNLFVSQIAKHISQLAHSDTYLKDRPKDLGNRLRALRLPSVHDSNIPEYDYKNLKKGLFCLNCKRSIQTLTYTICHCSECGCKELASETIFRHVQEFNILFPSERITTEIIQEWCHSIPSQKRVQTVLKRRLIAKGVKKGRYYILEES